MLNESMFGPMEVPILKGVGRLEITTFLAQYERYERVRDSRVSMGVDCQLILKHLCVDTQLLETIARYEMGLNSHKEVTEELLEAYFEQCLATTETYIPDLEAIFRKLRFPTTGGSREKVVKFFKRPIFW